jgi:hypothetical protein
MSERLTFDSADDAVTYLASDWVAAHEERLVALELVATKAAGLVRTSGVHWQSAEIQVVRQWWDGLVAALAALTQEEPEK